MALADHAAFVAAFPEFQGVSEEHIQVFLDLAAESVPEDPWGAHQQEGHLYLTAHLLSQSPYGMNSRLANEGDKDASTTYGTRHRKLARMVACGTRVI